MTDAAVRPATLDDVPAIRTVADRAWRAAYGDLLAAETIDAVLSEWYSPDAVRRGIERQDGWYFVGDGDEVVGYVSGGRADDPGVATLAAIYVDPDRWRDGLGSALLERFESRCVRAGCDRLRFRVLAENDRARAFYRSRGYDPVEEVETDLFGETVTEAVFSGALD